MGRPRKWPPAIKQDRGQDRVWINGKWEYLGPTGSEEARQNYARVLAGESSARSKTAAPAAILVADVVAAWWVRRAPLVLTKRGRGKSHWKLAFEPLLRKFGTLSADTFGPGHLEDLQLAMASGSWMDARDKAKTQRKGRQGVCRDVVNERITRIKECWRWAEREGLVSEGRHARLSVVRQLRKGTQGVRESAKRHSATLDEVQRVATAIPQRLAVARTMLLVQWWTCSRPAEIRTMCVGDLDTSGLTWIYRPRQHKTDRYGHPRLIPLGPEARALVAPYLLKAKGDGPDSYLFRPLGGKQRNRPYSRGRYSQIVTDAAASIGLKSIFVSYSTRHGMIDRVRKKAGGEAARKLAGHLHLKTTEGYGNMIDPEETTELGEKFG